MDRYQRLFAKLEARNEGAFVPFVTVGDPDPELSLRIIDTLIHAGADALELGIPFSDPLADGPVLQDAAQRALRSGVTPVSALGLVERIRERHPDVPIGLLVYANLVFGPGVDEFYARSRAAGVDSVLIADVPVEEAEPFLAAAGRHDVAPVLICPPNCDESTMRRIAAGGRGYTYLLSRAGVTGADREAGNPAQELVERLRTLGAPPPVLGFGISTPEHVRRAMACGVAGAIAGSAVVRVIAEGLDEPERMLEQLAGYVVSLKAATRLS